MFDDGGRVKRHGGSVILKERIAVLCEEMRRMHAAIDILWSIYDRARASPGSAYGEDDVDRAVV